MQYSVCNIVDLFCVQISTYRSQFRRGRRVHRGHDHEIQTLYANITFIFACFVCTIACLGVRTSSTVVHGMELILLHCRSGLLLFPVEIIQTVDLSTARIQSTVFCLCSTSCLRFLFQIFYRESFSEYNFPSTSI